MRVGGDHGDPVRLDVDIRCTACGRRVPGGIRTGRAHSATPEFARELAELRRTYLCGRCRDAQRVAARRGSDQ